MASIDCPSCGHEIASPVSECPECGNPVRQGSAVVEKHVDSRGRSPETREGRSTNLTGSASNEGGSGLPTWLLFVLVFVGGSVVLAAGVVAVVVVVGAVIDEVVESDAVGAIATPNVTSTVPAGEGEYGLLVGECIDADELDRFLSGSDFLVTGCDGPHDYEVYFVYEYATGLYPGEEAVLDRLTEACRGEFETYVGRDYETSILDIYRVWPGQDLWESGSRTGECLLFEFQDNSLTGSAYQSGW